MKEGLSACVSSSGLKTFSALHRMKMQKTDTLSQKQKH